MMCKHGWALFVDASACVFHETRDAFLFDPACRQRGARQPRGRSR